MVNGKPLFFPVLTLPLKQRPTVREEHSIDRGSTLIVRDPEVESAERRPYEHVNDRQVRECNCMGVPIIWPQTLFAFPFLDTLREVSIGLEATIRFEDDDFPGIDFRSDRDVFSRLCATEKFRVWRIHGNLSVVKD